MEGEGLEGLIGGWGGWAGRRRRARMVIDAALKQQTTSTRAVRPAGWRKDQIFLRQAAGHVTRVIRKL